MSERVDTIRQAFTALGRGSSEELTALFTADAQWLGVPGSGVDGDTPI